MHRAAYQAVSTLQVWILDANIGKVIPDKDAPSDVDKVVKDIRGLQSPIASRDWLYKYMEDRGYSMGLRLWMGSNLVPDGQGKLKWGFNIEGASGELADVFRKQWYVQLQVSSSLSGHVCHEFVLQV